MAVRSADLVLLSGGHGIVVETGAEVLQVMRLPASSPSHGDGVVDETFRRNK